MNQCRSIRFLNRLTLIALVLLVAAGAMCTVAASAADHERGPYAVSPAAP